MEDLKRFFIQEKKTKFKSKNVQCMPDVIDLARQIFKKDIGVYESVYIILVNSFFQTTGIAKISQGGLSTSLVDIRLICHYAIATLSTGVIMVHNHPSGNVNASNSDLITCKAVKAALKLLKIQFIDNIIITSENHLSFKQNNIL